MSETVPDMQVLMWRSAVAVVMGACMPLYRDKKQITMHDTALAQHTISIGAQRPGGSAQDRGFQTGFVIEMDVTGGYTQRMVFVVMMHQPAGQIAGMVVIDITQDPHRFALRVLFWPAQPQTQQVPHRL